MRRSAPARALAILTHVPRSVGSQCAPLDFFGGKDTNLDAAAYSIRDSFDLSFEAAFVEDARNLHLKVAPIGWQLSGNHACDSARNSGLLGVASCSGGSGARTHRCCQRRQGAVC